jgi:hypothetical protein
MSRSFRALLLGLCANFRPLVEVPSALLAASLPTLGMACYRVACYRVACYIACSGSNRSTVRDPVLINARMFRPTSAHGA